KTRTRQVYDTARVVTPVFRCPTAGSPISESGSPPSPALPVNGRVPHRAWPSEKLERRDRALERFGQALVLGEQQHPRRVDRPGKLDIARRGDVPAQRTIIILVAHQKHETALPARQRPLADFAGQQLARAALAE